MTITTEPALLDACTALVARLETRLEPSSRDPYSLQIIADDVLASLEWVQGVAIHCLENESITDTVDAGSTDADPMMVAAYPIGSVSSLRLSLWCVPMTDARDKRCLEETVTAASRLIAEAELRDRYVRSEQMDHDLRELGEAFPTLSSPQRANRCAELLARTFGFEQVSVFRRRSGAFKLVASSAQAKLDPHATRVRQLESAAKWLDECFSGDSEVLVERKAKDVPSDAFSNALNEWLTVRWIDQGELIVLGESKQPIRIAATRSWLVLESWLCRLNAKPGRRSASRLGAHSPLLKAAVVAAVIAGLAFFPMTIKVPAQGRLTPLAQQSVFAPTEGVITAVHFTRGQRVHAGDPLFELSSHDLSLRQADVVGKLLAAQEQLAVSIARRGDRDASASHVDRRVIEVRIEQLENQLRILEKRRDELTVRSPIDGIATVVLEHTLENLDVGRPVQGGQAIARVLQPESGYQLLLEIDDCDAGYVARAHAKSDVPLQCNYRRRSDPTRTYQASLKRLNESVHVNETGQRVLEATLAPTDADHQGIPESGVVGWIQSESRPAGFVLFRRVIQTLRMRGWI